jgi:hypothetical protein
VDGGHAAAVLPGEDLSPLNLRPENWKSILIIFLISNHTNPWLNVKILKSCPRGRLLFNTYNAIFSKI